LSHLQSDQVWLYNRLYSKIRGKQLFPKSENKVSMKKIH
jgi:hypothetical protein